jgi:hypothetical protein
MLREGKPRPVPLSNSFELVRYTTSGSLDTTFGGTGMVITAFPYTPTSMGGLGTEWVNGVAKIVGI